MKFHRAVYFWWRDHHPDTFTEANVGRVWALAQSMVDCMRGEHA